MAHDFIRFPELTNSQMDLYYLQSPHKQIMEDIRATVIKIIDGDTIRVRWNERNFDFPIRLMDTNAPEMNEDRGDISKSWLEEQILNEEVEIIIDAKQRVGKWGRLLGIIMHGGLNINEASIRAGMATPFAQRNEGQIPRIEQWLA